MLKRHDVYLKSTPICERPVAGLTEHDFLYYDKDGFELNQAEQKYYSAMSFPITHPILNHCCWQEPWFELEDKTKNLILDHSMFLCRAGYTNGALEQLKTFEKTIPYANLLIKTKIKWGYDFALDAVASDGTVFEVLHIEYDHTNYDIFMTQMIKFDYTVRHTNWNDAANRVWQQRDQWQGLKGFEQNNWKAKYLLGWDRAEHTEKSIDL